MLKKFLVGAAALLVIAVLFASIFAYGSNRAAAEGEISADSLDVQSVVSDGGFSAEIVIDGMAATEYAARGRRYVEALENAEYEVRVHNPSASRVAVALSVDGLNTIDARHTSAWDAHKWVIEPYGTIHVRGWQMSSDSARRFCFTTERDSYAAKLGQAANLGVISAVFFRERRPVTVMPVTPRPYDKDDRQSDAPASAPTESSVRGESARKAEKEKSPRAYPPPDDESAATGIGRSVANSVQWLKMDLDPRPVGEITIRYEYRAALVKLGIIPRDYPRPGVLDRRERAQGFEPKYCPQP